MIVSTKGRYALRVMIDLAEHQSDKYVPLKEVAARQEISEKYLENILKVLVQVSGGPARQGRRLPPDPRPGAVHGGGDPEPDGGQSGNGKLPDSRSTHLPSDGRMPHL